MAKSREAMRKRRQRRVRSRVAGTAERPRLNVYRSLSNIFVQVIDDESGYTLAQASTIDAELKAKMAGKKKTEQAQVVGAAVAERTLAKGLKAVVFDRAGYRYHGRVKALADAARAAGLEF
ncbi:MAG: 50S ribosomal protein L18 [Chloroflexi bacterium]|nr:50S ribosomal protein L18 [Chloroflexota bacterium]MBI3176636.1 50S ribosomal protein L18 [Chloroflexota bacterium]